MEQSTLPAVQTQAETIASELAKIPATLKAIAERSSRACLAMSQVQIIETDDQDKYANDLLVKVRLTLEGTTQAPATGVIAVRKSITAPLDEMKKVLMEPEKAMIEEQARIVALRNAYATKKLKAEQQRQADIELQRRRRDEDARVREALKNNIANGIVALVQAVETGIRQHVAKMTLENWETMEAKFNLRPVLKPEKYAALFSVPYDKELMASDVYAAIVNDTTKEPGYNYPEMQALYVERAQAVIEAHKADLPKRKVDLERIAELAQKSEVEAWRERERLAEIDAQNAEEAAQKQEAWAEKMKAEAEQQKNETMLKNDFTAQVAAQDAAPDMKGMRVGREAVVLCEYPLTLQQTAHAIIDACYSNPKFEGLYKRDKKGNILVNPDGTQIPADWLSPLLKFLAKEYDGPAIPGIEFRQTVTQTAKK